MDRQFLVSLVCLFACTVAAAAPPETPARRALLVGVTAYPGLDAKFQLHGPANDVVLMRDDVTAYLDLTE